MPKQCGVGKCCEEIAEHFDFCFPHWRALPRSERRHLHKSLGDWVGHKALVRRAIELLETSAWPIHGKEKTIRQTS
jgi:hypothetical protein